MLPRHDSELYAQFLSNNSVDPWVDVNSAPRKVMTAGHLAQALVIHHSEERFWQTGTEARYGEYCFSVKAPSDIEVLRVVERFPRSRTIGTSIKNPQTIVIYVDLKTRKVGYLDLRDYSMEHQYFGFTYKRTEHFGKITKGACFEEGTEFLVSPSIKPGGGYAYGTNLIFASFSHPATTNDGIVISQSALKKMSFDLIETRVASGGQSRHALNLFGDENNVKIFKDVGERIRPDGLLMATRTFDPRMSTTSLGLYDTMMLDMTYDEKLYTRAGDGTVVDIIIHHDNRSLPNGMNAQIDKYKDLTDRFYREILEEYTTQLRARGNKPGWLTDEFHQLVVEACAVTDYDVGEVVQKIYHKAPIDDWRIEFKIKYTIEPTIGNKASGIFGDKGVVVHVMEDNDMPVDERGNRVEIIMSPESPYNRQNAGVLYETYFNMVTREFLDDTRKQLSFSREDKPSKKQILKEMQEEPKLYDNAWDSLVGLYQILSPAMYEHYNSPDFTQDDKRADHLSWILKYPCLHILSPTDNMTPWRHAVNACEKYYPPDPTRLTYKDFDGNVVVTDEPIEIGHKYFMLLEKISDDWIAVSTAKTQHLGMLGPVSSSDKHAAPTKGQPVKALSEAGVRLISSYCGGQIAADLLDRNDSIPTHKAICYSILSSPTPTNIRRAVDRKKIPLNNSRGISLFRHILQMNGYKFVYDKYKDPTIRFRDDYVDKTRETI